MNRSDAISALKNTHQNHHWNGPVLGDNNISDFVLGTGAFPQSDDVSNAIREAVTNRISTALSNKAGDQDQVWGAWCKGEINVDFSDIQGIIDEIT
ncbi:MAG: hypothetical protein P8X96_01250 [Desulfobacteraceae bacterium]